MQEGDISHSWSRLEALKTQTEPFMYMQSVLVPLTSRDPFHYHGWPAGGGHPEILTRIRWNDVNKPKFHASSNASMRMATPRARARARARDRDHISSQPPVSHLFNSAAYALQDELDDTARHKSEIMTTPGEVVLGPGRI